MSSTQKILTYAGTIPFWGLAVLMLSGVTALPVLGLLEPLFTGYAIVIAAFMMGSSWGSNLHKRTSEQTIVSLMSNAQALLLWLCLVLVTGPVHYAVLAVLFLWVLWQDFKLFRAGCIDSVYWLHRRVVTAIVVIVLAVMAGATAI